MKKTFKVLVLSCLASSPILLETELSRLKRVSDRAGCNAEFLQNVKQRVMDCFLLNSLGLCSCTDVCVCLCHFVSTNGCLFDPVCSAKSLRLSDKDADLAKVESLFVERSNANQCFVIFFVLAQTAQADIRDYTTYGNAVK